MKLKKRLIILIVVVAVAAAGILILRSNSEPDLPGSASGDGEVWTCSMHPQIRLPKPGKCPICSMPLVPAAKVGKSTNENRSMLDLSEHARAMASVETAPVARRKLMREIRLLGKVQYNESSLSTITARVEGYAERLFVDFTGVEVKKGDHLIEIYSPDLMVAQQELLIALANGGNSGAVEATRAKLMRWGLTKEQVDKMVQSRQMSERLTLYSPMDGTVTEKMVVQKSAIKPGDVLYKLANLESVWVYLDIYESDLPLIQYGQIVEGTSEAFPAEVFKGRVWFISPILNEETRTIKVLVNMSNTSRKLKPGMFVSASIRAPVRPDGKAASTGVEGRFSCPMHPLVLEDKAGQCPVCRMDLVQIPGPVRPPAREDEEMILAVPASAVLDSGLRRLVYVEKAKGEFIPVEVVTGPRAGEFYPVFRGLKEGDNVAVRGAFLLDSQFQISGLKSLFNTEGQSMPAGHQHAGSTTAPASSGAATSASPPEHKH